ncbi:MAG: Regulator of chromosome condensation repeat-containing protein, partial [Gemmatimonadetes bacterium]|nr:Regulator of chromosome condensation repeat-containing protein [Gemmatimonadota bacterium]
MTSVVPPRDEQNFVSFSARRSSIRREVCRALLVLAALACGESPTAPVPIAPTTPTRVLARVNCVADTRAHQVTCAASDSGAAFTRNGSPQVLGDLIVGGQGQFITLTSSSVTYTGDVFSFNTTVQNLIGQKLGTLDGVSLDPTGVRVFFEDLPHATSGSGTIDFTNPVGGTSLVDGYGDFTATNQPYYQYNQIIATGQTSLAKNWRMHIPATVGTFIFSVYVSAPVQYPNGWIDVTPATKSLKTGDTQQLTATVRDVVGRTVTGQTVTWASGNTGVAT